jgi:centrin-1
MVIIQSYFLLFTYLDAELLEMIERADADQDGQISPDEFYAIMSKKAFS